MSLAVVIAVLTASFAGYFPIVSLFGGFDMALAATSSKTDGKAAGDKLAPLIKAAQSEGMLN